MTVHPCFTALLETQSPVRTLTFEFQGKVFHQASIGTGSEAECPVPGRHAQSIAQNSGTYAAELTVRIHLHAREKIMSVRGRSKATRIFFSRHGRSNKREAFSSRGDRVHLGGGVNLVGADRHQPRGDSKRIRPISQTVGYIGPRSSGANERHQRAGASPGGEI